MKPTAHVGTNEAKETCGQAALFLTELFVSQVWLMNSG